MKIVSELFSLFVVFGAILVIFTKMGIMQAVYDFFSLFFVLEGLILIIFALIFILNLLVRLFRELKK